MADSTTTLLALLSHLKCSRRELHKRLLLHAVGKETFGYSTLTTAVNGTWPTGPTRGFIEKALASLVSQLVSDEGLNQTKLTHDYQALLQPQPRGRPIHAYLKGAWFLVQYRGKRNSMSDRIAEPDFRIGVIVYGSREESGRVFQLVGESTLWTGYVKPHPQDNLLYYSAEENSRSGIDESISMVMLGAYAAGQIVDHHGVILGVARGDHDSPHFPIYASRVLLWRIKNYRSDVAVPLAEQEIATFKQYCGYISAEDATRTGTDVPSDPLMAERKAAIVRFITRGRNPGNDGDRIFVRS
jgi:hypothetical protein